MKFLPLLDLSIKHSYYADGCCPDFLLTPDPKTCRLLRNLRGVLKSRADGVSVVVPVDEEQSLSFIPLPKYAIFTFQLNLRNPDFALFTDLTTVTAHASGPAATCKLRYPIKAGRESPLLIPMAITISLAQFSINPLVLTVEFIARQLRWSYYFVTDLNANGREFAIVDADKTSSWIISEQHPDPIDPDPVAALLARQYSNIAGIKYWRFVSTAPVPCQRRPRHLQLCLGDSNLIEHLPNPSIRSYTRIDIANESQDTFYQVVKYISDSSLTRV